MHRTELAATADLAVSRASAIGACAFNQASWQNSVPRRPPSAKPLQLFHVEQLFDDGFHRPRREA